MPGFDAVDRQFARREIVPECAACSKTTEVKLRYRGLTDREFLCTRCFIQREIEDSWGCGC